jgi:hypothetical protein
MNSNLNSEISKADVNANADADAIADPIPKKVGIDRRHFLKVSGTASAGMSLGFFLPERAHAADTPQLNVWIEIEPNNTIVIRYARAEMVRAA